MRKIVIRPRIVRGMATGEMVVVRLRFKQAANKLPRHSAFALAAGVALSAAIWLIIIFVSAKLF